MTSSRTTQDGTMDGWMGLAPPANPTRKDARNHAPRSHPPLTRVSVGLCLFQAKHPPSPSNPMIHPMIHSIHPFRASAPVPAAPYHIISLTRGADGRTAAASCAAGRSLGRRVLIFFILALTLCGSRLLDFPDSATHSNNNNNNPRRKRC